MALLTNDIYVGDIVSPTYHFQNPSVELGSYKGSFALDVIGNELSIDTFTVTIRMTEDDLYDALYDSLDSQIFDSTDDELYALVYADITTLRDFLRAAPYGTPVWWYVSGSFYVKGYLKSIDRVSKYGFKLTCTSGVGLLDTVMHSGGMYSNTPITTVLSSIVNGAFSYTVSNEVAATTVSGRLPYDTRRNNLHRLLFATGAALIKDDDTNDYDIEFLNTTVVDVPPSRIALQGSIQRQLPSNKVEVTEHQFFADAMQPTETLFDNTAEAEAVNLLVVFDAAVVESTLAATGTLTISSSGANFAVVSGNGTLTGKYYVHTTNVMEIENNPSNAPERVRRVTDCELVTAVNSYNVARRVLSYFQSAKTVKAKIMMENERCGQLLQFYDAFGDLTKGYLAKADTLVTSVIGANCELIDGYVPGANGNNYLYRQEITQSGTWTVPAGVTRIRLVLIGGGQGGYGGMDGSEGDGEEYDPAYGQTTGNLVVSVRQITGEDVGYYYRKQYKGAGGAGSNGGAGAKFIILDVDIASGEVITFAIGAGGTGGVHNNGSGTDGGDTIATSTTIGTLTSASGAPGIGYNDPMTGDAYATSGTHGEAGADGGMSGVGQTTGWLSDSVDGYDGDGLGQWSGGAGGRGLNTWPDTVYGSGGGGGGAAHGANGNPGTDCTMYSGYRTMLTLGSGGNGANAVAPNKAFYGCGGDGGHGGGGGGSRGGGYNAYYFQSGFALMLGDRGQGGAGSAGGDGGDGIAIIYW